MILTLLGLSCVGACVSPRSTRLPLNGTDGEDAGGGVEDARTGAEDARRGAEDAEAGTKAPLVDAATLPSDAGCMMGDDTCNNGGACNAGDKRCTERTLQTCDATGKWDEGSACLFACVINACGGSCVPNVKRCGMGANMVETCDATGTWVADSACAGGTPECSDGMCRCSKTTCQDTCTDTTTDAKNCGRCGRDCLGGTCTQGKCSVVELGAAGDGDFEVSGLYLYHTDYDANLIYKRPITGGMPQVSSEVTRPALVYADPPHLYLMNIEAAPVIGRTPLAGGQLTKIADSDLFNALKIRTNGDRVFAMGSLNPTYIKSYLKSGAGSPVVLVSTTSLSLNDMEVNSTHLFYMAGADVVRVPVTGGDAVIFGTATKGAALLSIALDATHVYYATSSEVGSIPLGGGMAKLLRDSGGSTVLVDEARLYWSAAVPGGCVNGSEVLSMPKGGGPIVPLAKDGACFSKMVQDAKALYWAGKSGQLSTAYEYKKVAK